MITICKTFTFDAAHHIPTMPDGHKCRHMHGHTYSVDLILRGDVPDSGYFIDYGDIAKAWQPTFELIDHKVLNDIPGLEIPTTEVLAKWIHDRIGPLLRSHAWDELGRGPWREVPHGFDNEAWICFKNKRVWTPERWRALMRWGSLAGIPPLWAVVPDVVGDRDATLRAWDLYEPEVRALGFRRAFAAQDGMTFGDVPDSDCAIFLGGGTEWKLEAIDTWCTKFPDRVHVARVNTWDRLVRCWRAGAVSVDGTGWFHKTRGQNQSNDLRKFLRETAKT